jgi:hypothetical protein
MRDTGSIFVILLLYLWAALEIKLLGKVAFELAWCTARHQLKADMEVDSCAAALASRGSLTTAAAAAAIISFQVEVLTKFSSICTALYCTQP